MAGKVLNTYQISANTVGVLAGLGYTSNSSNGGGGYRANRTLIMRNLSAANVYYGSNGVTTSNGAILLPLSNNVSETYVETSANVYLIVATSTSLVSVAEVIG